MSGNEENPNREHECLFHFIDGDSDDYDTMECTICKRRITVSIDSDKRDNHYQMYTGMGSPTFGMS